MRGVGRGALIALVVTLVCGACSGGSPRVVAAGNASALERLVLKEADVPPGSQPIKDTTGAKTAEQLAQDDKDSGELARFQRDHFRVAYTSAFLSPTAAASGGTTTMRLVGSYAAVFPDADAASRAVAVLRQSAVKPGGAPVDDVPALGLGSDPFGLHTSTSGVAGHDYAFGWRVDNAVFTVLVGTNSPTPDPGPPLSLAQQVARRAAGHQVITTADLPGLALPPDAPPPGTQFDPGRSGPRQVDNFSGQQDTASALRALGFQGGYINLFLPQTSATGSAPPLAGVVFSSVQAYGTAEGAKDAFAFQTQRRLRGIGQGLEK